MKIFDIKEYGNKHQNNYFYFRGLSLLAIVMMVLVLLYMFASNSNDEIVILANSYLPMVFLLVLLGVMLWRFTRQKILFWCPLSWFLYGAAIAFGYGSLAWYFADQETIYAIRTLYSATDRQILETNLLNTVSMLLILLGYWLGIKWLSEKEFVNSASKNSLDIRNIKKLLNVLTIIYIAFEFVHLPVQYGFISLEIPNILLNISKLGDLIIFFMFFLFGKGFLRYKYYGAFFCVLVFFIALPSFGKGAMLAPFFAATLGYFWATTNIKVLFYGAVLILFMFVIVAKPISVIGRAITYDDEAELLQPEIIYEVLVKWVEGDEQEVVDLAEIQGLQAFWARNSFNNVQSYLIEAYDNGNPGYSLDSFFIAMIPRVIWPDKPIITNIGLELDALVKGWDDSQSSLAPTFNGEAYWNGGWGMVGLVCTLIGMQFAQFAVYANKYLGQGDVRYFVIALMGIQFGLTVEAWVIAKYIGGYLTILCFWFIIKKLLPYRSVT